MHLQTQTEDICRNRFTDRQLHLLLQPPAYPVKNWSGAAYAAPLQFVKKASQSSPPQRRRKCNYFFRRHVRWKKYRSARKRASFFAHHLILFTAQKGDVRCSGLQSLPCRKTCFSTDSNALVHLPGALFHKNTRLLRLGRWQKRKYMVY